MFDRTMSVRTRDVVIVYIDEDRFMTIGANANLQSSASDEPFISHVIFGSKIFVNQKGSAACASIWPARVEKPKIFRNMSECPANLFCTAMHLL